MRLYDSLTRRVRELVPEDGTTVRMYSCGPTVYRYAHIGNMRSFMLGDLIRRAVRLECRHAVRWVMNVTDVGHMTDEASDAGRDRMDLAAEDEGKSPQEIAAFYTEAFHRDRRAVGIEDADAYPAATEHIDDMIELTKVLLDRGHAYEVGGNVYYSVASFSEYGKLSGNTLEALRAGHRQDLEVDPRKRHHADFALWKRAGPGRLMKWPSPWGEGFPGWHIECSAMSMRYLGDRFDVHTGGNDLKFPHHEDEIAQSEGAVGHQVVGTWVHGGFINLGAKMSKSAGNIVRVADLEERGLDPLAYRMLCFGTRYRSEMEFDWEALEGAHHRLTTIRQRVADWSREDARSQPLVPGDRAEELDRRFREAVASDLDLPRAMVVLNEAVAAPDVPGPVKLQLLTSWDRVLGLDLERLAREAWEPTEEVRRLIGERDGARSRGDFAIADAIRERLASMGLEVMDTPAGTRVRPRH